MIVSVFAKRVGNDVRWNMPKDKKPTQTDIERGKRIRALMQRLGLTQSALGVALGLSQSTIAKYCSGKIAPSDEVLYEFCDRFRVSADYLLYGKEQQEAPKGLHDPSPRVIPAEQPQTNGDHDMLKTVIENLQKMNEMFMRQAEEAASEKQFLRSEINSLKEEVKNLSKENADLKKQITEKDSRPYKKTVNGSPGE